MKKRKICIVTGTRADYGLLYWLMKEIEEDNELELQIIATGMHLSPEFGLTYKVIEDDGFVINEKIEIILSSDTPIGISKSIGLGTIGFAEAFQRLRPDILVLLGDRFEILAAAQSAMVSRIPIAHIHGGELTEGVIDEAIRHSVTKMAQIHFTSTENYRNRVIQLGEQPEHVYNLGAPGLDNINRLKLLSKENLEKQLNYTFGEMNFLVTYHPETLSENNEKHLNELFNALDKFPKAKLIFTKSNSDTSGRIINSLVEDYVSVNSDRAILFTSLGQVRYLSCLKYIDVVIGNSSSGIIEVPFFKKATINIGDRQKGRECSKSVINSSNNTNSIYDGICKALSKDFRKSLIETTSIYGEGNASPKIKSVLKNIKLDNIIFKRFYDQTIL